MSKQKRNYASHPKSSTSTAPTPSAGSSLQISRPGRRSVTPSGRSKTASRVSPAAVNCYSFFTIYANIDGFDPAAALWQGLPTLPPTRPQVSRPSETFGRGMGGVGRPAPNSGGQLNTNDFEGGKGYRPVAQRSELDRWVLEELNQTIEKVLISMDAYDNFEACKRINEFVDGLSNWYVRRSRDRFWAATSSRLTSSTPIGRSTNASSRFASSLPPSRRFSPRRCGGIGWRFRQSSTRKRPSRRLSRRRPCCRRCAAFRANEAPPRNRLAGPLGPHGEQAESRQPLAKSK